MWKPTEKCEAISLFVWCFSERPGPLHAFGHSAKFPPQALHNFTSNKDRVLEGQAYELPLEKIRWSSKQLLGDMDNMKLTCHLKNEICATFLDILGACIYHHSWHDKPQKQLLHQSIGNELVAVWLSMVGLGTH